MGAPANPDLPSSWQIPGVYFAIDTKGTGAALNNVKKRALLWGYKRSTGNYAVNTPVLASSQSAVNAGSGSGSDLAGNYAAAVSQRGAGLFEAWLMPIAEPVGGSAATRVVKFIASNTSALAAGAVVAWIAGRPITVPIAVGDTPTTIGANLATAIGADSDAICTASNSSGTVTLTARHAAAQSNDFPIIVNIQGTGVGITASPGIVTFTGNPSADGTISVTVGANVITSAIDHTVQTSPTLVAAKVAADINAGSYAVTASSALGVLTLLYATDRVVQVISCDMGTVGTTTAAVSVNGSAGSGTPTITSALSTLDGQAAFPIWVNPFTDVSSSTGTVTTMVTDITTQANGLNQKGVMVFSGDTFSLSGPNLNSATGAGLGGTTGIVTATGTTGARGVVVHCKGSPQRAFELAARVAAEVVIEDYYPRNYAGTVLNTQGTTPLLFPHRNERPGLADQNSAIYSYGVVELVVDEQANQLKVLSGVTTCQDADQRLHFIGTTRVLDAMRFDMNAYLSRLFLNPGKVLKSVGTPHTSQAVTPNGIKNAVKVRLQTYVQLDWMDDTDNLDQLAAAIVVNPDPSIPNRILVGNPQRPVVPLTQIAGVNALI